MSTDVTDATKVEQQLAEPKPLVVLKAVLAGKVNFASAQNGVSVLRSLRLVNEGTAAAVNVTLSLTATPAILRDKSWRIDRIAPGTGIDLVDLETPLDTAILGGLDEVEIGQISFQISIDGQVTDQIEHRIELLARDEWGGLAEMDNILAAFVSPNQSAVARLLKEASRLLEAAGHSGSLEGYQSGDPMRVWMIAGAIWSAATGLGLTYAVPPASFERMGQKVRDPERIVAEGLATCLDSTLLLAAAFEAAGLNTAILFSHGHAWVGVWLVARDFGRLVEPDVVAVRKAAAARDFVPLETTLLTKRPSTGFEAAVDAGRDRLSEARETEFIQVVDINRARAARIRPLASHRVAQEASNNDEAVAAAALPRPLDLGRLPGELIEIAPTTALGRIERWQRKLLDLSLANRLLNFKDTKLAIPMICPDVSGLEDQLADGAVFRLLALKDEHAVSGRDLAAEEARQIEAGLARDAMARGQVAVPLTSRDMINRLTELYRKARSDAAEGGTNTLFLAVGFLRWKRTDSDPRHYRAPLLLLPVKLERRSAQSEFRLSQLEDEVRINATLLEFLKRDFELRMPELEGELPRDASGLDIPRILQILRHKVRDVAGFEVLEDCALSTFSFAKYLMWKDLVDRTDNLRESRLVRHLVDSPTESFAGSTGAMPQPADIDRRHAPADLLAPLPADSSQLAAVMAAAQQRDYVLIGPPGTGKSQTITNIIADQLGRGRTVLFVAEKAAALDVVHRRLERHGLGTAVLELHSNKADRKAVLTQLGRSWDRGSTQGAADWVRVTDDLRVTRDQLNGYVAALHSPGTQGFSVYQAIGRVAKRPAMLSLAFPNKDCHDQDTWLRLRALAAELGQRHRIVAELSTGGPLALVAPGEWSFGWQDAFVAAARRLRVTLHEAQEARLGLAQQLGYPAAVVGLADVVAALGKVPAARLGHPAVSEIALNAAPALRAELAPFAEALRACRDQRQALAASYTDDVIADMPLEALDIQWREAQTKMWPMAGMAKTKLQKLLQSYAHGGTADPVTDIAALKRLLRAQALIVKSTLTALPGFAGERTDIGAMSAALEEADGFARLEATLTDAGLPRARLMEQRANLMQRDGGTFEPLLRRLVAAETALAADVSGFTAAGGDANVSADQLMPHLLAIEALQARLPDWMKWLATRGQAAALGLQPIIDALQAGADIGAAEAAFESAYMAWWLRLAMDAAPMLRSFAHWEHDALILRFRALDDAMTGMASAEVMRRLGNDLPTRDSVPRNSELGILRHQLGLQRPTAAIRGLISQMPTTFGKLAPCVLMSPLSVAQYLPAGQAQFDLVIFDEASQISTWDAIGAIARGKQAIIVGDPRQLPPTNFFGRSDDGADGDDLAEYEKDMPSILDEVSASGVPTQLLNWHYRSRDEALIAFSNHFYYGGSLVTFPSPDASGNAVKLHKIAGTYMRGTGRTNPDEARAIVQMIRKRLVDWLKLPEKDRPTLGVITFNAQQQSLILDLLDAERQANPALEWFFSDDREEPLIVKNLENIQGDERDVMLFSITFGPDGAGKLAMNFGALNGDGGEKRLNVAVTRARAELHVFASITADQIDLTRTGARGVKDLKAFLDFAARGAIALSAQDKGSVGPVESPFEEAVLAALTAKGWELHSQIGVSGFRIDLGVRHPDHAGTWLVGVECDGARYHSSATARDRDRIRQAVLEGLGWSILRIWSTDWFRNPVATADRVDVLLREVLERDRQRRLAVVEVEVTEADSLGDAAQIMPYLRLDDIATETPTAPKESKLILPSMPVPACLPESAAAVQFASVDLPVAQPEMEPLSQHTLQPDNFFDEGYSATLAALVLKLVQTQGAMTEAALARSVAQLHGWQRTGGRIQARVATFHRLLDQQDENGTVFFWPKGGVVPRVPFAGLGGRSLREVSRTEIAWMEDQHTARISASVDPVLELSRLLGIARLSQDARSYLDDCRYWRTEGGATLP